MLSPVVTEFLTALSPGARSEIKAALRALKMGKGDIKALDDNLEGYQRLRVGPYRVILRYRPGRVIECVYLNRRAIVYEVFEREVVDKLRAGG